MKKTRRQSQRTDHSKGARADQQSQVAPVKDEGAETDAQALILRLVAGGATKTAIAKAVGVTDMTILSVSQGKTKVFRKLKKLQSVYDRWRDGKIDLSGKKGKKTFVAPVAEDNLAGKKDTPESKATAGKKAPARKSRTAKNPDPTVKANRNGSPSKKPTLPVQSGFQLPEVTEEMVAGVEEQIRRLQAQVKYMRDLIAIRKKYGM